LTDLAITEPTFATETQNSTFGLKRDIQAASMNLTARLLFEQIWLPIASQWPLLGKLRRSIVTLDQGPLWAEHVVHLPQAWFLPGPECMRGGAARHFASAWLFHRGSHLEAPPRCCQTKANQFHFSRNLNSLGCAEAAPLGKSGGAVQLEI
jgi:hypothetical protein